MRQRGVSILIGNDKRRRLETETKQYFRAVIATEILIKYQELITFQLLAIETNCICFQVKQVFCFAL